MTQTNYPSLRKALIIGCTGYHRHDSVQTIGKGAMAIAEQLRVNYDGTPNFEVQLMTDLCL